MLLSQVHKSSSFMAFEENAPYTMLWVEFTMRSENNICIFIL